MGFWSGLGKVLKVAAPIAASFAIPGVGGLAAKGLGGVFGKMLGHGAASAVSKFALPGAERAMAGTDGSQGGGGGWLSKLGGMFGIHGGGGLAQAGMNASGNIAKGMASGRAAQIKNQQGVNDITKDANHMALVAALGKNLADVSVTPPPGVNMGTITGGLRPSALQSPEGLAAMDSTYKSSMNTLDHLPKASGGAMENILGTVGAVGAGINQAQQGNQTSALVQKLLAKQQAQEEEAV